MLRKFVSVPGHHLIYSEQFLQHIGRPVGFHGPYFHLPEPLAAVLRLAAELLCDQRVRANYTGVTLSATKWPSLSM